MPLSDENSDQNKKNRKQCQQQQIQNENNKSDLKHAFEDDNESGTKKVKVAIKPCPMETVNSLLPISSSSTILPSSDSHSSALTSFQSIPCTLENYNIYWRARIADATARNGINPNSPHLTLLKQTSLEHDKHVFNGVGGLVDELLQSAAEEMNAIIPIGPGVLSAASAHLEYCQKTVLLKKSTNKSQDDGKDRDDRTK